MPCAELPQHAPAGASTSLSAVAVLHFAGACGVRPRRLTPVSVLLLLRRGRVLTRLATAARGVALALCVLVSRRRLLKEIHPSPSVARLLQGWVPGLKPLLSCLISPCKIKFEYTTPMKISTPQLNKGLMRIESSTHRRRRPPITLPTTVLQQLLRVFYAAYILRLCVANRLAVSVANRLGPSLNPRRTISRLVPPTAAPPAPSPPPPPAPGSAPSGVAPAAESVLRRRPPA
jgi:hypothetical protein